MFDVLLAVTQDPCDVVQAMNDLTEALNSLVANAPKNADGLEIMNSTQAFYDQAWTKLLWVVGVIGGLAVLVIGILGYVVPRWLDSQRTKAFELKEVEILAKIEERREETAKAIEALKQEAADVQADVLDMAMNLSFQQAQLLATNDRPWDAFSLGVDVANKIITTKAVRDQEMRVQACSDLIFELEPKILEQTTIPLTIGITAPEKLRELISNMKQHQIGTARVRRLEKLLLDLETIVKPLEQQFRGPSPA